MEIGGPRIGSEASTYGDTAQRFSPIQGYEAVNMLRKGQVRWMSGTDVRGQNQFVDRVFGLAA